MRDGWQIKHSNILQNIRILIDKVWKIMKNKGLKIKMKVGEIRMKVEEISRN